MGICGKYGWLPVTEIAGDVVASLASVPRLVVTAPPGAGKSTLLPLAMLEELPEGKIIMLEPRRIAARQVAERMAAMLGEKCGDRVGYRIRFESKVSLNTRIEVVTEGILERMLVADSTLEGVSMVIFDEFHERSLASDMALALAMEAQEVVRPDLRIVIMSATIDASGLCRRICAPHLHSPGRMHDVEIVYGEDYDMRDCAAVTARAVSRAYREQTGDILAFLPGQGEIARCSALLQTAFPDTDILPLYGMLSQEKQLEALTPSLAGRRRIVLATPVAETSLTIEGVSCVVDSGLCRTMRYEPASGLSRLVTVPVSLDMAAQRTGRAGRLGPGVCYRLWSKAAEHRMRECREPEIVTADLAPALLGIAAWGESEPGRLPWVTPPPAAHWAQAASVLRSLGALDAKGRITAVGKKLSSLPCHPRIARMLADAGDERKAALGCDIAAILEEKDPVENTEDADICTRIDILRQERCGKVAGRWRRIADIAAQYRRLVHCDEDNVPCSNAQAGFLIASAYPEKVAMRDGNDRYRMAGGEYVTIGDADPLGCNEFLAVATASKRVFLAAPLDRESVAAMGRWVENAGWDNRQGRVVARQELRVGSLVVDTRQIEGFSAEAVAQAVCEAAPKYGLTMFDFNDDVQRLQIRVATVADWHPELGLPAVDTETLLANAADWLPMYIGKATTVHELRKIDMCAVIWGIVGYEGERKIERLAPSRLQLPSGRHAQIDYRRGASAPVVRARLQDCFGMRQTPCLDDGHRPVLMELLSPGYKPVQLTQDMEGFWRTTYFEIRKELRRRYPKHAWPEDV